MKLNLGVLEMPYTYNKKATNTGDVAEILEAKYEVMSQYYQHHDQEIADMIAAGLEGALESLLMGAPPSSDPFASGTTKIETSFRTFLDMKEIETYGILGVPTQAALKGVSHRFKKPRGKKKKKKGQPQSRPSFIDTGLYQTAFRAWVD